MPVQPRVPADAFAAALKPFQRRLRRSMFVKCVPITCAFAFAAFDVASLTFGPEPSLTILGCIGALAAGVLSAWAIAWLRTPSLSETARALDRHARLDDRAVTALQFASVDDEMSRLVVREAMVRLETTPVTVLPFDVSARWGWSALGVLAASGLIVISLGRRDVRSSSVPEFGASQAGPSAQAQRANARQGSARGVQTGDGTAATPERPDALAAARRTNGSEDSGQSSAARAHAGSSPTESDSATGDRDQRNQSGSSTGQRAEAGSTSRGTSDGERAGGGDISRAAVLGAGGRGARGATRHSTTTGGGVAGGAVAQDNAVPTVAASVNPVLSGAEYRSAYARAESAIARERVPPRLRSYVRDYFLAIRPQSPQ
jgi:hypothetical protein